MRICRFFDPSCGPRVGLVEDELVYDLTAVDSVRAGSLGAAMAAGPEGLAQAAARARRGLAQELGALSTAPHPDRPHLLAPIERQEVWAAGVTYVRSKQARMEESEGGGSFYDRVYTAPRPELFLKATPHRVVGPGECVRIRRDSRWNVPEPELTVVAAPDLRVLGYTIGNDMSSRDIEGENPLYLPQAKVYVGSCALGPTVLLAEPGPSEPVFPIRLTIRRGTGVAFEGETSTSQMKRSFAELMEYLGRANQFPDGVFLLTGTGIVPPDTFTLQVGDIVEVAVPEIGVLRNPVALSE